MWTRFKAQKIVDEAGLLACAMYVDLNLFEPPLRNRQSNRSSYDHHVGTWEFRELGKRALWKAIKNDRDRRSRIVGLCRAQSCSPLRMRARSSSPTITSDPRRDERRGGGSSIRKRPMGYRDLQASPLRAYQASWLASQSGTMLGYRCLSCKRDHI